jgi:hypothetical protein
VAEVIGGGRSEMHHDGGFEYFNGRWTTTQG